MTRPKPLLLCILDGWGHREETENNAIARAKTPHWDAMCRNYPHSLLDASAEAVGLPAGQMGNSEVGHMHIGAGRTVMQDLPRINAAIENGDLANNEALAAMIEGLKQSNKAAHLMGLFSPGGVHSHQKHLAALAKALANAGVQVWFHAFLDGRDTPPKSALDYLQDWQKEVGDTPLIQIATVSGRYYAMDRDKRWERIEKAYLAIGQGEGERFDSAIAAIEASYAQNVTDEFVLPCVMGDYRGMEAGDGIIMGNFRADRARQILQRFLIEAGILSFEAGEVVTPSTPHLEASTTAMLGMVEYSSQLANYVPAMFPPEVITDSLGEVVSKQSMRQLRIAETEKYAHVTFFFNGGSEQEYDGEERILVPSPNVATYDLQPEMSAPELTEKLIAAIESGKYDLIVCNYANTDMVGHSGNLEAATQAVEAVDHCLGQIKQALLRVGGAMLITADHGNAEQMQNPETGAPHTAHTTLPVPFLLMGAEYEKAGNVLAHGTLADIAPTCLKLLSLPIPAAMTGKPLLAE
jgi:2,3-bisphosphoglycerate-independent phosphoglycerate mutase